MLNGLFSYQTAVNDCMFEKKNGYKKVSLLEGQRHEFLRVENVFAN